MRVLVVDDDGDIAVMIARIVAHLGHKAVPCSDPIEALVKYADEPFDVVIADYGMQPNGIAILTTFESAQPWTRRILLTASHVTPAIRGAILQGIIHVALQKPATIAEINAALTLGSAQS